MCDTQEAEEGRDITGDLYSPTGSSGPEWSPLNQHTTPRNLRTLSFSQPNNIHATDRAPVESPLEGRLHEPGAFVIHEESREANMGMRRNTPSGDRPRPSRRRPGVPRASVHGQPTTNPGASLHQNGDRYRQQAVPSYFFGGSPSFAVQGIQILTTPQRTLQQTNLVAAVPCSRQIAAPPSYYAPAGTIDNPFASAELALQISPSRRSLTLPSTSTSASATTSRGRKKAWWVVNCFAEGLDENMRKIYLCRACQTKRSGKQSASRLAEHVWKCSKVDDNLKRRLFQESQHIRSVVRTYSGESQSITGQRIDNGILPNKRRKGNGSSQDLATHCSEAEADDISMRLVRAVVDCCLPLTIFDSTSTEGSSIRDVLLSARPGYKDMYPSRHTVMVKFLPRLYKRTFDVVKTSLKHMLSTGYGTIVFDGWEDINRSSVVNVLLRVETKSARKSFFLDSVFTGYSRVGAVEYVKIIEKVMEGFGGMRRVCGVASDNARACVNAREALAQKYRGLIGIQDQAHVADLLMKDIGKLDFVRNVLDKVNLVVVETRGKRKLLSFLREALKRENSRLRRELGREDSGTEDAQRSLPSDPMHPDRLFPPLRKTAVMLRKPSRTRFASISDTLEAFIRTRDVLYQVVGDREFDRHLYTADNTEHETRRELYKELVRSVPFLDSVKEIHNVFRLCRRYLRIFDKERETSAADVVPCTESLGEALMKVPTSSEYLTPERLEEIRTVFKQRKDGPIGRRIQVRLVEDVHIAAYLLHPTKFPHDYQPYDRRFYSFVKRYVGSTMCSSGSQDADDAEQDSNLERARVSLITKIMTDYDNVHGTWLAVASGDACGTPAENRTPVHYELGFRSMPLRFWLEESRVGTYPELCEMALRTLSISPSSCSAERTFSMQGRIRTKRRNRLDENVVRKMMFIKWNIKHHDELINCSKGRPQEGRKRKTRKTGNWLYSEEEELNSDISQSEASSDEELINLVDEGEALEC